MPEGENNLNQIMAKVQKTIQKNLHYQLINAEQTRITEAIQRLQNFGVKDPHAIAQTMKQKEYIDLLALKEGQGITLDPHRIKSSIEDHFKQMGQDTSKEVNLNLGMGPPLEPENEILNPISGE